MHGFYPDVPVLRESINLGSALPALLETPLPALPVTDADDRYAGVFGEREALESIFPGYLGTLKYAGFVPEDLDEALERRRFRLREPIADHLNREHVELPPDASDASIAETFLHHRVLIVPIVDDGRILGVVTRTDFFRVLAREILSA